jgi:general transcription factor 3C polypeptide 3 (transcription factor C subunit 4)
MRENQFSTDAYRLYAAINRLCKTPNSFYNADHNQKYLARQIRATDHALSGSALKARSVGAASYTSRDEAGNPIIPTEMNVQLVMLYGHVLYCTGSYAYAINYFYRAYALEPHNDMVNLSLALAYIHLSFKRQSENRHFLIMQGFSFLFTYYDSRKTSKAPSERQEAEYNIGRTYHMLGLTHLAIPYYERCLAMSEEVRKDYDESVSEDFSIEAAFALQGIYSTSGEMELAQQITRKWLVM